MNKNIMLLLIIFLFLSSIVYSVKTFVIQETDKLSLGINATDPDADRLTINYSFPLNNEGEWQTGYGDAGTYNPTITVSDGATSASEGISIIVNKKEEPPVIDSFAPVEESLKISEGQSLDFKVSASDLNNDKLGYEWLLDGSKTKDGADYTYDAGYNDAGAHKISVRVSDGATTISREWELDVEDVDVQELLNGIKDIVVDENDIARLELPDFQGYGLAYSISGPLGDKNEWKTSYEDAGDYNIAVNVQGRGFAGNKSVKISVNDVDRPPVFEKISDKVINENEELAVTLNAQDPDGDNVTYSAGSLPEGAKLDGNVFTWRPSYDTVKKEGLVNIVLDKFRILSNSFSIQFDAVSKGKKAVQTAVITVRDVNRPPAIEDLEPIIVNEGGTVRIVPNAYDLDGDRVSLSYSGFISSDTYESSYGDAGTYHVKVTASDGLLETSKFVQIIITHIDRQPIFKKINDINAQEGDGIAILLDAYDPDGDKIEYSIDNPPEGSSLKGNAFLWTPGYSLAGKKETKKFDLVFVANDGLSEVRQTAKVMVSDKNRAPKIIDSSKNVVAKVNEPVLMFVKAVDEDGDGLAYTWDFGLLEKYKATAAHQRIFTSRGTKSVKVIVSDGIDETEQVINVNVV